MNWLCPTLAIASLVCLAFAASRSCIAWRKVMVVTSSRSRLMKAKCALIRSSGSRGSRMSRSRGSSAVRMLPRKSGGSKTPAAARSLETRSIAFRSAPGIYFPPASISTRAAETNASTLSRECSARVTSSRRSSASLIADVASIAARARLPTAESAATSWTSNRAAQAADLHSWTPCAVATAVGAAPCWVNHRSINARRYSIELAANRVKAEIRASWRDLETWARRVDA